MGYKVLAQVNPSATTDTTLYTVPSGKVVVVSTLAVCNRGSAAIVYRIAVRIAGATLANEQYLAYDVALPANSTDPLTWGITLGPGDVLTVRTSLATASFSAFGDET